MGREQRANAERREALRKMAEAITGRAADDGQIIALGFTAFIAASFPDWRVLSREQLDQLRVVFFAGAQHLFGSINTMLDDDAEPTDQDLRRMTLIAHELNTFIEEYKQLYGIADPDVGPPPETKQ
jgi:hypothetical protein